MSEGPVENLQAMLGEALHRCANDLQLVVGLLNFQARACESAEAKDALADTVNRIGILVESRSALAKDEPRSLHRALGHAVAALQPLADARSIAIDMTFTARDPVLTPGRIDNLALMVNELATNALRHGFAEADHGTISISVDDDPDGLRITVDDDGGAISGSVDDRLGLSLVERLGRGAGASLIKPQGGDKRFILLVKMS